MKHLIIIGVGGFAREVYWHAKTSIGYGDEWDIKGFLDGDVKLSQNEYNKLSVGVLGDINDYVIQLDDVFVCVIGEPKVKAKLVGRVLERGGRFINLIHTTASICETARMGMGNILLPNSCLSDNVTIGDYTTINTFSGLGHDAELGDFSTLSSGVDIMGYAKVGSKVFLGSGARALPHSKIEDNAYVGAGSIVFKRVKKGLKVFGNPALPI